MKFTTSFEELSGIDNIIITVGTPLRNHIESDVSNISNLLHSIKKFLRKDHNIILRSTVAPKTTDYLKNLIEKYTNLRVGKSIGLSFCPERIAENQVFSELKKLPQIIGTNDDYSKLKAKKIFRKFKVQLFFTNTISAELVKLFNNTARYIDFAVSNQLAVVASQFDQNIYDILEMANYNYPRGFIKSPGLTAGTCLRKDFGFINELTGSPDLLLSSWKINEFMPYFISNELNQKTKLKNKCIGVLGYTFKKDSDDKRDSLTPKLIRYLEKYVPKKIILSEPNIKEQKIDGYRNYSVDYILKNSDIIIIAMNHTSFSKNKILKNIKKGTWVADIWNSLEFKSLIYKV